MNARPLHTQPRSTLAIVPKPVDLLFLRAFIGTSYPVKYLKIGHVILEYPYAFPILVRYMMTKVRRSKPCQTDNVIHLPAPRKVNYLSDHPLIGQTIAVSGFAQESYVMCVFQKWGGDWVQLRAQIGKHTMTTYRKLADLEGA